MTTSDLTLAGFEAEYEPELRKAKQNLFKVHRTISDKLFFALSAATDDELGEYDKNPQLKQAFEYTFENVFPSVNLHDIKDTLFNKDGGYTLSVVNKILELEGVNFAKAVHRKIKQKHSDFSPKIVDQECKAVVETAEEFKKSLVDKFANFVENRIKPLIQSKRPDPAKAPPDEGGDENAIWGRYAFGSDRFDVPYEANTPDETDTYNDLRHHFRDAKKLDKHTAEEIKDLGDAGKYSKLLQFPAEKYPVVWRGMTLNEQLFDLVPASDVKNMKVGQTLEKNFDGNAIPRSDTASWTVLHKVARKFSFSAWEDGDFKGDVAFAVIAHARVSDNEGKFILNPEKIYTVGQFSSYANEAEVIGIGPIKVFKLEITRLL